MSTCPQEETLRLLGTEALGDATYTAIEQHVEGCAECKAVLERLTQRRREPLAVLPDPERRPRILGFEIACELDRGGMSVVYRAIQTGVDRPVALKVMPRAVGPDASAGPRRRWLREARAISSVPHPNVVPLYDCGEADGWFYLVLEYIRGGTLKKRLGEPIPPRVAAGLMETIARAAAHLHGRGVLHLDLKPSNILLDNDENASWDQVIPRISDFGLALADGGSGASLRSLAGIRGTPSYMAPEQVAGSRAGVEEPADIHALGAILYEMLTGRAPFLGSSTLETLEDQVRGQNPVPPRRLNPKIPRDLETIALKCLEKNPARRYASAESMAGDLRRWLDGKPISARPVSPIGQAKRWCCRQPVIAALAATLLTTLIGSVLGLLALLKRSETQRLRSEANYKVASQSLSDMMHFARQIIFEPNSRTDDLNGTPKVWVRNAMERILSQEIELSKRHPLDAHGLQRLAMIYDGLAYISHHDGKPDEARSLIEKSIGYWESSLALDPDDSLDGHPISEYLLGEIFWMKAFIDFKDLNLYERWNAKAVAALQQLKFTTVAHAGRMCGLSRWHRAHADYLISRGETDRARKELEEDLDMLGSAPVAETAFPTFVLSEALTLARLGRPGNFTLPRSPIEPDRRYFPIQELELDLAELAARRIGWLPSIVKPPWLIPDHLPTEAWTDRVISSIKSDASTFALDHTRIPAIGWIMRHHCVGTLSWQRRAGKLGDAHRIADQLLTLAERLTQSYPDQAAAYMLLCEGYAQRAKNAYREGNEPMIEPSKRKALDAAIHAAALEPENDEARNLVKDRRVRLSKLTSK